MAPTNLSLYQSTATPTATSSTATRALEPQNTASMSGAFTGTPSGFKTRMPEPTHDSNTVETSYRPAVTDAGAESTSVPWGSKSPTEQEKPGRIKQVFGSGVGQTLAVVVSAGVIAAGATKGSEWILRGSSESEEEADVEGFPELEPAEQVGSRRQSRT